MSGGPGTAASVSAPVRLGVTRMVITEFDRRTVGCLAPGPQFDVFLLVYAAISSSPRARDARQFENKAKAPALNSVYPRTSRLERPRESAYPPRSDSVP